MCSFQEKKKKKLSYNPLVVSFVVQKVHAHFKKANTNSKKEFRTKITKSVVSLKKSKQKISQYVKSRRN
jgi:hypothetical protein